MLTHVGRSLLAQRTSRLQLSGIRKMMAAAQKIPDAIRLEVGEPDFETPAYILDGVKKDLDSGLYTHYTPVAGYPELRRALGAKMQRDNAITADPDSEIMVSVGAAGALYAALMATVDPGDEVLIPDPGYPQYTQMTLLAEGAPVYYPLRQDNGFRPDLDELRALVSGHTKLIILNSPQNPTGGVLDKATLDGLAALALEHDLLVISDEVYSTLIFDQSAPLSIASLPGMFPRTITINSFSKAYAMTGWRLGYTAAAQPIMTEMIKMQSFFNSCASSVSQRAGLAALRQSSASEAMTAEYRRRRDWLVAALNTLPSIRCAMPAGAFYVFPDITAYGPSSEQFSARLLELAHVTSVPGTAFGKMGEGHVRLSYATSLENLHVAVERMREALPRMKGSSKQ
jgi:aspartate/methionine/tyrosine aminotransferase